MKPISALKRRLIVSFLTAVFVVATPILILFSSGYRFGKNWNIMATGGIYIESASAEPDIYLDGKKADFSHFLRKGFLIQNVIPGVHSVKVEKNGYSSWEKLMTVEEQIAVEGFALIVKKTPELVSVPTLLRDSSNPEYLAARTLFASTTKKINLAPADYRVRYGEETLKRGDTVIWEKNGNLYATFAGNRNSLPYYFCGTECRETILLEEEEGLISFDFYPERNDAVLISNSSGVYALEIDRRKPVNRAQISEKPLPFMVSREGTLYLTQSDGLVFKFTFE